MTAPDIALFEVTDLAGITHLISEDAIRAGRHADRQRVGPGDVPRGR